MEAVVEVGAVFCFHGQADRVRARQQSVGEGGGVVKAGGRSGDVVDCGEEERGAGFGNGDRAEAGGVQGGGGMADGTAFDGWR